MLHYFGILIIVFGFVGGCFSNAETKGSRERIFHSPRDADKQMSVSHRRRGRRRDRAARYRGRNRSSHDCRRQADVIVGDSDDEHVSDTPAMGSRPTATSRADIPEAFVITREMWGEMRASQEQLRASQEQLLASQKRMIQSQGIVLRSLAMTGRRVERMSVNQVRFK